MGNLGTQGNGEFGQGFCKTIEDYIPLKNSANEEFRGREM